MLFTAAFFAAAIRSDATSRVLLPLQTVAEATVLERIPVRE
ncbi:hypothetical protein P4H39_15215 [Paenibacillus lautus]|nr:hypothetical protein [Paenibacillus lautus]MEC0203991.1 hypothetical protein [Paenibacillus lautus]